jgi:3-mercaptopyruvate sulfurtransferase SseA
LPTDIKLQPSDFNFLCDNTRVRDYKEIVRISNFNLVASDTKGPDAIKIIDTRLDVTYDLGHIPSSINIPFVQMLNPDKTFFENMVFEEVLPHLNILMQDLFGNYVLQKILDYGS